MSALNNFVSLTADEQSSCDSWGVLSTTSDFRDYISPAITSKINNIIKEVNNKSTIKEILFTPSKRIQIKRFNNLIRRSILIKEFNKYSNINISIELIKYFNKYGFLNSNSQYKFLSLNIKYSKSKLINKLSVKDVYNIKKSKYNTNKDLLTLAILVRNKNIRRENAISRNINNLSSILKNIDSKYINPFLSLYVDEGILEHVSDAEEAYQEPCCSKHIKKQSTQFITHPNSIKEDTVYKETVIPERDIDLLKKLQILIRKFINNRKRKEFRYDIEMEELEYGSFPSQWKDVPLDIQPEMMEPEQPTQQQESGPVVLNALQQDEATVSTVDDTDIFWINNSTSDQIANVPHASSMEILVKKFIWNSVDQANFNVFNIKLPFEAINSAPDHPAAMMFNQYAYWNGDIKIRIHINTTPFHVGKLIFSWYYSQDFDDNNAARNNIASSVLLPNVCFDASLGDDIIMNIPFKNYRSMLCTKKKAFDSLYMYLGTLRCHVFNPLTLSTATTVDGYVHVSFVNNNFTGISPRITVQPEMLPMQSMIKMVEGSLNIIDQVSNMDNPPVVNPPVMYTPQFSDSFATGVSDVNNIHALRLNPLGQTQHPKGSSTSISETNILDFAKRWGFLRTLTWDTAQSTGSNILRLPATAELAYNQYYQYIYKAADKAVNAFVLPPVSVIAGLNAYNRGSIEYKFEFINSRYHTGAVLASFTPAQYNVSLTSALQSYNTTLDLGNVKSYIFRVPYINERPYNPRYNRELSNNTDPLIAPIGEINLFILNELRAVTGVGTKVYINVYIRAGPDFEFAVPVSPLYTINFDAASTSPQNFINADKISPSIGVATWRYMDSICKGALVGKYGDNADTIMQMHNMKMYTVYSKDWLGSYTVNNITLKYLNVKNEASAIQVQFNYQFAARFVVNDDKDSYHYVIFFYDQAHAVEYVRVHYALSTNGSIPNSPTIEQWKEAFPEQTTFYLTGTDSYSTWNGNAEQFRYKFLYSPVPEPQVDEVLADPTTSSLGSLTNGYRMFGEQFRDLKDYCRRYQPYASYSLTISKNEFAKCIRIPLTPIGLDITSTTNSTLLNIIREGLIPFICSAYRFYRGGLRFKIIVTNFNGDNKNTGHDIFYIQHKPDVIVSNRNIKAYTISTSKKEAVFQSGYAYSVLSTSVNNGITVEVPCYIPTNLLMLQKPNFSALSEVLHYSLGVLDIYYENPNTQASGSYRIDIHYAFADDMDLSCFVGIPPVTSLTNPIVNLVSDFEMIQAEGAEEKQIVSAGTSTSVVPSTDNVTAEAPPPNAGWYTRYITEPIKNKLNEYIVSQANSTIRTTFDLGESREDDTLWKIMKDAMIKFGDEHKHIIASIISQMLHLFVNPTVSTLAIVIITILTHMGLNSIQYIPRFTKWLSSLFGNSVQPETGDIKTETSPIEAIKSSIITSIVEMSVSAFGKTSSFLKGIRMPDFTDKFFSNIRFGALTINSCITMIKNLCEYVPKVFQWLGKIINPCAWYRWMFFNESKFVRNWVNDVHWVLDPNNTVAIHSQVKYNYHIQLLIIVGRDLVSKTGKLNNDSNVKYIYDLNTRLNKLYEEVAMTNIGTGNIGVEPFCFCIHGNSQIGKTYITKDLAAECLKAVNYQTYDNLFYTRPTSCKHWDGVQNEPVCVYDDFAHVITDVSVSELIGEFLLLKSKATFTPPRAHLRDKGRKYNPLIVALTMNKAYPKFESVLAQQDAWQNRRDVLIHGEFVAPPTHPKATKVTDLPYEIRKDFKHVKFSLQEYNSCTGQDVSEYKKKVDVPQQDSSGEFKVNEKKEFIMESVTYMTYKQLKWYVSSIFRQKYAIMRQEYLKDLDLAKQFYPESDKAFSVNLSAYIKFAKSHRLSMNSTDKEAIRIAEKLASHTVCDKCKESVNCICDLDVFDADYVGNLTVQPESDDTLQCILDCFENFEIKKQTQNTFTQVDLQTMIKDMLHTNFPTIRNIIKTTYELDEFIAELAKHATLKEIPQLHRSFLEAPCLHKWLVIKSRSSGYMLDYDDDTFHIMYNGLEKCIDRTKCSECVSKPLPKAFDVIYFSLLKILHDEAHISQPLPDFVKQVEPKYVPVLKYTDRYNRKMQKLREEFEKEIAQTVDDSTWLGKIGSAICSMAKPLLYILSIAVGLVGIRYGYNMYKDSRNNAQVYQEYIEKKNHIESDALKKHVVTEDCIAGKCIFCKIDPQMAYPDSSGRKMQKREIKITPKQAQAEMAMDIRTSLDRSLTRNYFFLVALTEHGTQTLCRCLGIQSWSFICIDHYIHKIKSLPLNTIIEIRTNNYAKRVSLHDIAFLKLKNSALLMGTLPHTFPQFKSIVDKFVSTTMVPNLQKTASLFTVDLPQNLNKINEYIRVWHNNIVTLHQDTLTVPHIIVSDDANLATHVDWYWSYQTSGKGMCGSVLVTEMNTSAPIMGIHIAGEVSGGRGYAEVICRETLEECLRLIDNPIKDIEIEGQMFDDIYIPFNSDVTTVKSALSGTYNFIGTVPNKFAYNPPVKSKNIHSLCYNKITESTYDFPHLSHRDERFEGSPMVNGCQHHVIPPLEFEDDIFTIVSQDVKELILAKVIPLRNVIGKLTVEQSVCGIPSILNYEPMEFSTSEGFPFSSIRPKGAHDKRWLFDLEVDESGYKLNGIHSKLQSVMDLKESQRLAGIVPATIFTDCLKDLKLPKEKCHKTRIFSISPVDFTIQFRQYFYDFTIAFQNALLNVESAVGINVDSYQWHDMVQKLLDNSSLFVCGDYSKFGPRLMAKCVLKAFDIIAEWYMENGDLSEDNKLIRLIMGRETAFSKHLMLNKIYEVFCGAPSGCPITTILNNIVNMLYIRTAYLTIMRENYSPIDYLDSVSISKFQTEICVIFYGDDLIMTVKDNILDKFNAKNISLFFKKYDITFTDALKTGNIQLNTTVFDVETSFLKRNIKRHPFRPFYVAAMDKRAIEETCNWIFEGHEEPEASIIACESMLLNAFGHGTAYYNDLRNRVISFWRSYQVLPRIPTWNEVDWRIYEGNM